jgi:hypothetical protein
LKKPLLERCYPDRERAETSSLCPIPPLEDALQLLPSTAVLSPLMLLGYLFNISSLMS